MELDIYQVLGNLVYALMIHITRLQVNFMKNSVVIVCSVSGESKDIIGHINRFKKDDCCIVSITNTENCTIAKMSDYNIPYYVPYVKVGIYDITTQIPIISIIERIGRKLQIVEKNLYKMSK